ncbi:hypothetical protein [Planktothricoides raciborskii]|uniref:NADH dehydrogenase n=1 Tax=Planktothricoides raciborskii FACHB-1370 TaxID=2949576 RepID=A0ABR8EE48_9CYAN|nr:hypothetical protein [Planktothricoides raciborskii]MBD2544973.1 hypothetical protein [Planktothricoides raciborskii FACHB-1370]MBD2584723.1 hypothetical protein [Planktothricoides raciborskii FACHB-1261]
MNLINKLKKYIIASKIIFSRLDRIQRALGRIELNQQVLINSKNIQDNEFQVYSQWGEDGIIQFLLRNIYVKNHIFVEFGVENYQESNTRFLITHNNWSGLVIDGSSENIEYIKSDRIYWAYNLKAECAFITTENINNIFTKNGLSGEIGLLSIDIDGNDYWVWEAIECINPAIVICEYNSLFGCHKKVTIPYDENFVRQNAHFSCIYYGASIAALEHLGQIKGYSLVGSNSAGNNVFFVRNDLIGNLPVYSAESAYVKAQFRESRDDSGNLNFLDFQPKLDLISEMPLYDLDLKRTIKVKDLRL